MDLVDVCNYLIKELSDKVKDSDNFIKWLYKAKAHAEDFICNKDGANYSNNFPEDGMLICNIASDLEAKRITHKIYTDIFDAINYDSLDDGDSFPHELFEDAIKDNKCLHVFSNLAIDNTDDTQEYVRVITIEDFIAYYPNYTKATATYTSWDIDKVYKLMEHKHNEFENKEYRFTADALRNLIWVADKKEFDEKKEMSVKSNKDAASYIISCLGLPLRKKENKLIYIVYPKSFNPVTYVPIGINASWTTGHSYFLSYPCQDHDKWGRTRPYNSDDPALRMKERVHAGCSSTEYHICSPKVLGNGIFMNDSRDSIIDDAILRFENTNPLTT